MFAALATANFSQDQTAQPHLEAQLGNQQQQPGITEEIESFTFLCQAETKRYFHILLHLSVVQEVAPGVQPFHTSLFPPSTSCLFKFLFQGLVHSESLLATQRAWSDKKTEVFSQQLLSGNNVSNKMKPALHSWKIYYNSPNAHRGNVNTKQQRKPGLLSQGTAPSKPCTLIIKHPHRGLHAVFLQMCLGKRGTNGDFPGDTPALPLLCPALSWWFGSSCTEQRPTGDLREYSCIPQPRWAG